MSSEHEEDTTAKIESTRSVDKLPTLSLFDQLKNSVSHNMNIAEATPTATTAAIIPSTTATTTESKDTSAKKSNDTKSNPSLSTTYTTECIAAVKTTKPTPPTAMATQNFTVHKKNGKAAENSIANTATRILNMLNSLKASKDREQRGGEGATVSNPSVDRTAKESAAKIVQFSTPNLPPPSVGIASASKRSAAACSTTCTVSPSSALTLSQFQQPSGKTRSQRPQPGHHHQQQHHQHSHGFGVNSSSATSSSHNTPQLNQIDGIECSNSNTSNSNSYKKRCTDRYDSSESSDSGLATLSCTDSSTASSEDASEPGSPYSPPAHLADDHSQQPQTATHPTTHSHSGQSFKRMPPQTILATGTTSSPGHGSGGGTVPSPHVVPAQNDSSDTTDVGNSTLSTTSNSNNVNNCNAKTGKQKLQPKNCHTNSGASARNNTTLPTLQWPWNNNPSATATTALSQSHTTTMNREHAKPLVHSGVTALAAATKKRNSTGGNGSEVSAKKSRTTNAHHNGGNAAASGNGAGAPGADSPSSGAAAKRLKAAALEESQTKITGYFKSQMKAQIHQAAMHGQLAGTKRSQESGSSHGPMSPNLLASPATSAAATSIASPTSSLSKFFNILATQMKEATTTTASSTVASLSAIPTTLSSSTVVPVVTSTLKTSPPAQQPAAKASILPATKVHSSPSAPTPPAKLPVKLPTMPAKLPTMPALKKIERSTGKPTKIAQVAPNLRKTPTNTLSYAASLASKSPAKKHVPIAPRTPEVKQQQAAAAAAAAAKTCDFYKQAAATLATSSAATAPVCSGVQTTTSQPQPSMMVAAIRLPNAAGTANGSNQSSKTSSPQQQQHTAANPPKIAPVSATATQSVAATSGNVAGTAVNVAATAPQTPAAAATTLYQLPLQLPNLVQLPQLLAPNGANIMQLSNVAAAAKNGASSSATAAAQAAAAQYFLNGTVFKLQQFTTATTTTATSAIAAASGAGGANSVNPFNLLNAGDLQEMLLKQQQQQQQQMQQQFQQQQQKAAAAAAAAVAGNPANFQEMFQQQIAAAIMANQQQQQQQQQFQQLQRLGAGPNMQQQPVFMATPAGLLLNAASLPAMLAQAAAALAVNNTHQQPQQQQHKMLTQQLPALQPIQSNHLPGLSSIFPGAAGQPNQSGATQPDNNSDLQQQQQQLQQQHLQYQLAQMALVQQQQQQQQQYVTTNQPPPLSSVSGMSNTATSLTTASTSTILTANTSASPLTTTTTISNASLPMTLPQPHIVANSNGAGGVATGASTTKLAIVKASTVAPTASLGSQFQALNSQPPPLVTISNAKSNRAAIAASANHALAKPYHKRALAKPLPAQQTRPQESRTQTASKLTNSGGKIIATPTTPPPLVPALCATSAAVSLRPIAAVGVAKATPMQTSSLPTPALISISSSVTGASTAAIKIEPSSPPPPAPLKSPTGASVMPESPELFDLVKNSNGAISITPTTNSVAAMAEVTTAPSPLVDILKKEDSVEPSPLTAAEPRVANHSVSLPMGPGAHLLSTEIKMELMEDNSSSNGSLQRGGSKTEAGKSKGEHFPNGLNHECSSSSFSSNSISSAADLSLEASTPASLSSSTNNSATPSPAPSPAPSLQHAFVSPRQSPTTVSGLTNGDSNSSHSYSGSLGGASSRDMLSELVTSTCLSSGRTSSASDSSASRLSLSIVSHSKNSASSAKHAVAVFGSEENAGDGCHHDVDKRNLPTPESGIGGSLSLSESSNSIVSAMSNTISKSTPTLLDVVAGTSEDSSSSSTLNQSQCGVSLSGSNSPTVSDTSLLNNGPSPPDSPTDILMITNDASNASTTPSAASSSSIVLPHKLAASPRLSPTESSTYSSDNKSTTPPPTLCSLTTSTTIDVLMAEGSALPKAAISPILSQPKTIRFPAASGHRHGPKGAKRHDGVCYWDKCNKKHDSNSKLLDHMQHQHVNTQTGPFACLWVGCKVFNKESCSRRWLERHVLSHGGSKQFKCIVEGCGLRFGSQLALQKHVNNHFTATETKESTNKRTSDPPVPKQLRKNGKKLRYRRQPFSARMFDFFDMGIMEGLQHRLRQMSTLTQGTNSITFYGQCTMRRRTYQGSVECFVRWSPREIISDEWVPESSGPFTKTVNLRQMKPSEKTKVESLLKTAYKLPYSPNLFDDDYIIQQKNQNTKSGGAEETQEDNEEEEESESDEEENDDEDDEEEDDDDAAGERDEDDDKSDAVSETDTVAETESTTTSSTSVISYQQVLTITNLAMQQRRKHPRKPQKHQQQHVL